jgi:predicted transcriptional regulator
MLGRLVHWLWIRHDLKHIFEYRTAVIENLFSSEKYKLYTSDMNQGAVA